MLTSLSVSTFWFKQGDVPEMHPEPRTLSQGLAAQRNATTQEGAQRNVSLATVLHRSKAPVLCISHIQGLQ